MARPAFLSRADARNLMGLVAAASRERRWSEALQGWRRLRVASHSHKLNKKALSVGISVVGRAGLWEEAEQILQELNLRPDLNIDVVSFNAVLSAYSTTRQWTRALAMLEDMRRSRLGPDIISFNTSILACGTPTSWRQVLRLWEDIERAGLRPNASTTNSSISAFGHGKAWKLALELSRISLFPDEKSDFGIGKLGWKKKLPDDSSGKHRMGLSVQDLEEDASHRPQSFSSSSFSSSYTPSPTKINNVSDFDSDCLSLTSRRGRKKEWMSSYESLQKSDLDLGIELQESSRSPILDSDSELQDDDQPGIVPANGCSLDSEGEVDSRGNLIEKRNGSTDIVARYDLEAGIVSHGPCGQDLEATTGKTATTSPTTLAAATTTTAATSTSKAVTETSAEDLARRWNGAIAAAAHARQLSTALGLLTNLHQQSFAPTVASFGACLAACSTGQCWEQAILLVDHMETQRVDPNAVTHNYYLKAFQSSHQWEWALDALFQKPSKVTTTSSSWTPDGDIDFGPNRHRSRPRPRQHGKYEEEGTLREADLLIVAMACERGRAWEHTLALLDAAFVAESPSFDAVRSLNIEAQCQGSHWPEALRLLFGARLSPPPWTDDQELLSIVSTFDGLEVLTKSLCQPSLSAAALQELKGQLTRGCWSWLISQPDRNCASILPDYAMDLVFNANTDMPLLEKLCFRSVFKKECSRHTPNGNIRPDGEVDSSSSSSSSWPMPRWTRGDLGINSFGADVSRTVLEDLQLVH